MLSDVFKYYVESANIFYNLNDPILITRPDILYLNIIWLQLHLINSWVVSFAVPELLKHNSVLIKKIYLAFILKNLKTCVTRICDSPQSYRIKTPPSAVDTWWKMDTMFLDSRSDSSDQADILVSERFWLIIGFIIIINKIHSLLFSMPHRALQVHPVLLHIPKPTLYQR